MLFLGLTTLEISAKKWSWFHCISVAPLNQLYSVRFICSNELKRLFFVPEYLKETELRRHDLSYPCTQTIYKPENICEAEKRIRDNSGSCTEWHLLKHKLSYRNDLKLQKIEDFRRVFTKSIMIFAAERLDILAMGCAYCVAYSRRSKRYPWNRID